MPFSINIFDRDDLNAQTQFEVGEKSTINLKWLGSDSKLEHIIGSELSLNMMVLNFQDGFFGHLNTQDERRFWVIIIDEDTGNYLWQGHILPDSYSEPYQVGAFPISIVATCGLGTLKKQYLPESYYQFEKSKVDFLSTILKLTGLELDIYIDYALRNKFKPEWHSQYLDGTKYVDRDKKDDAYEILAKMMEGSLCRIHQDNNAWFIESLTKLSKYTLQYDVYDFNGNFKFVSEREKTTRNPAFFATPIISSHTPLKTISAFHELDESVIDEEVYKVKNDGYVLANDTTLVNRKWVYTSVGFTPKYNTKDGKVFIAPFGSITNYIKLRKEILLSAGDRVEWVVECTNYWDGSGSTGQTVEELVLNGRWKKQLPYDIYYTDPATGNEVLLYSNYNGGSPDDLRYQLEFGDDRKAELRIPMIAPATAYYNVKFYQPQGQSGDKTTGIFLDNLECNPISADDEQVYTDTIDANYTQSIDDLELTEHDDMRQLANLIRLQPLATQGDVYDTVNYTVTAVLSNADGEFIQMPMEFLQLALAHSDAITVGGTPLTVLDKIYNYLGSQEMYLQYDPDGFGGTVQVDDVMVITLREFAPVPSNIDEWQLWADDFYGISFKRYGAAYIEVLRNLYSKAHPILTGTCKGFISPRDLVMFNYMGDKVWYVLDCEQHLDRYETTLILSQNFYGEAVTENLPPIVDAGPDQVLSAGDTDVQLSATASDPDGSIVTILWEAINPPDTVNIIDPDQLATEVDGLNEDEYEFRITVTDDVGLTASDTVRVGRAADYTLVLTQTVDVEKSTNPGNQDEYEALDSEWYDISIDPPLAVGQTARLIIDGIIVKETPNDIAGAKPTAIFSLGHGHQFFEAGVHQIVVLMRQGDVKTLALTAKAFNSAQYGVFPEYANKVYAKVQADITAEIIEGQPGLFTNLPIQKIVEARK